VIAGGQAAKIIGCYIHNNTTTGLTVDGDIEIIDNIISANGSHGISVPNSGFLVLVNNTIDGNTGASTDGVNVNTSIILQGATFLNNQFTNNGRDGVRVTTSTNNNDGTWADYNNFFGNAGVARTNFPMGQHDLAINPAYVNAGAGNYAVGLASQAGFPGIFPASTSQGYLSIGAVQSPYILRGGGGACIGFQ
jgi:hypothetical protein